MMLTASFLALLSAVHAVTAAATAKPTFGLNDAAKLAGKMYFGTATDNPELNDTAYLALLSNPHMFGQLTPANSMKWDAIQPEQGTFDFTGGDQIVALAEATGKIVRGHNLVWNSQLPSWVTSGTWTNETLTAVVENHVTMEVSHYKGKIYAWDVVNEPLNGDGTLVADLFYNTMGSGYIAVALKAARAADPNAKLYINDYNLEFPGAKFDGMVSLIKQLKADGVPIDGVGFESHFILGQVNATALRTNMEILTALGVDVAVTELDDRMQLPATTADLEKQKSEYREVVQTCLAVPRCVGVTVWDFTDKYSWIPGFFTGFGAACPWDENLNPKPAYNGILDGFRSFWES